MKPDKKNNRFKPTFTLNSISKGGDDKELPLASCAWQLFNAYNSESKNIYWTSCDFLRMYLLNRQDNKNIYIINLIEEKYEEYDYSDNIKYFHIPITDDFMSGTTITENFEKIMEAYKFWEDSDDADLIIHCKMGIHRSFSVAALLSMFIFNINNDIPYDNPTSDDFYNYVNMIQLKNKYIFEPAYLTNENIIYMYDIFTKYKNA